MKFAVKFTICILCNVVNILSQVFKSKSHIFYSVSKAYFPNITSKSIISDNVIISTVYFILCFHIKLARKRDIFAFAAFLYTLTSFKLIYY